MVARNDTDLLPCRFTPANNSVLSNVQVANRTGGAEWACEAVFEDAASLLASIGVPAYVRHSHTADEGTWWPSATGPNASWHPLVQATGRNLPMEFLTKAKAAGIHVILYHYMKVLKADTVPLLSALSSSTLFLLNSRNWRVYFSPYLAFGNLEFDVFVP